ncbi:hypothetical protein [Sciscionella sediminilitoris]|uniref:hypothetical protein n=1 Tax=Sciscionella sediminilitoris TaxID=1445613 RepID=UPI0004DF1250|nr:hypothetical protein [Sciscionella sp. SE31]
MAGIQLDNEWVSGYVKTIERAGATLGEQRAKLTAGQLSAAAFGELGRQLGAANAYAKASNVLLDQLAKGGAALGSVAGELGKVAGKHNEAEEDNAARIARLAREDRS